LAVTDRAKAIGWFQPAPLATVKEKTGVLTAVAPVAMVPKLALLERSVT
jgi:hypothetical protein